MKTFILLIACAASGLSTTTKIQDSGCQNNTSTKVATLSSTVTAGHTIDFVIVTGLGTSGVTVADNNTPASNVYTSILVASNINGGQTVKTFIFSAIAANTQSSLTITATTTNTLPAVCAFEWSDAFNNVTLESAVSISNTSNSVNVGCTSTGTAPNTTVTTAAAGDIVLVLAITGSTGGGRVEHDKQGTDTTYGVGGCGGSCGDNIASNNNAGWGLGYKINAAAATTYTAGFTRFPNQVFGVCSTVVRSLAAGGIKHRSDWR